MGGEAEVALTGGRVRLSRSPACTSPSPRHHVQRRFRCCYLGKLHPQHHSRTETTMIKVQPLDQNTFRVTVEGRTTTTHTVTVSPSYCEKLTGKRIGPEALVEKSFEFLLERESNTSILSSFELPVIGTYFPEYETSIRSMLAESG